MEFKELLSLPGNSHEDGAKKSGKTLRVSPQAVVPPSFFCQDVLILCKKSQGRGIGA
jgi:hypothetical protein